MDRAVIRKWVCLFCGIFLAVAAAGTLSRILVDAAGLTGGIGFLAGFLIYALTFFSLLYGIEHLTGTRFFGFSHSME